MVKRRRLIASGVVGIVLAAAGCTDRDAQRIGQVSGKAFDRASAFTEHAGQRIGLSLPSGSSPSGRAHPDPVELSLRVSYRLQWDQVLEGSSIKVHADRGVVSLTGAVTDDVQRRRAMDLAQSTLGVERVQDALEIAAQAP